MERILHLPQERTLKPKSDRLRQEIIEAIQTTQTQLKHAHNSFNHASDSDLIDSYIFEISSLQAMHNYLQRQLRAHEH
ncbi:MAG: DUF2508 family protein [Eubacteriales bacterium]